MTTDILSDVTITTEAQFNSLLSDLLFTAWDGGVEVAGAWECSNSHDETDWEVEVIELLVEEVDEE